MIDPSVWLEMPPKDALRAALAEIVECKTIYRLQRIEPGIRRLAEALRSGPKGTDGFPVILTTALDKRRDEIKAEFST